MWTPVEVGFSNPVWGHFVVQVGKSKLNKRQEVPPGWKFGDLYQRESKNAWEAREESRYKEVDYQNAFNWVFGLGLAPLPPLELNAKSWYMGIRQTPREKLRGGTTSFLLTKSSNSLECWDAHFSVFWNASLETFPSISPLPWHPVYPGFLHLDSWVSPMTPCFKNQCFF